MLINETILKQLAKSLPLDRCKVIANLLDTICPVYGIGTADIFHEFIARLLVECKEFTAFAENLNYKVESLIALFTKMHVDHNGVKYQRITVAECQKFGRYPGHPAEQVKIANLIYGRYWGKINLGNTQEGDGWIFRGAGPIQTTGRGNITQFTDYYNNLKGTHFSPMEMADLLRVNIEIGIHSACWIFAIAKDLIDEAIDDNLLEVVKKINGGTVGLKETEAYYQLAKQLIK